MKKFLALIMALTLCISAMAGCGSKKASSSESQEPTKSAGGQKENTQENKNTAPKVEIEGTELSTFMNDYLDAKTKTWDAMTKQFDSEQNLEFTMGVLPFTFADFAIIEIALFDALTVKDGNTFKGKLFLTDIDAWKKVSGNIIEFGYDYTYTEDKNQKKKGDHEISNGKYDKDKKSLIYEHFSENNGIKNTKTVVEITKNTDKSYSCQIFTIGNPQEGGKEGATLTGYFTWFEGENIISVLAEKENASFDFTYSSIFGKQNVKPEEMAKDMTMLSKVSLIDGKAVYENLEK